MSKKVMTKKKKKALTYISYKVFSVEPRINVSVAYPPGGAGYLQ